MSCRTYTFPSCWVHTDTNWTETVFHDGTRVTAVPEDGESYHLHALDLGYRGVDAPANMSQEHELLHTFLADRLRNGGASPTLWAVAHGQTGMVAPIWEQEEEEALVLAFQRYLNGDEPGNELQGLAKQGISITDLRQEALTLIRGDQESKR